MNGPLLSSAERHHAAKAALRKKPDRNPSNATVPPPIRGPPVPPAAYSIKEFCAAHRISEAMYFKLRGQGLGPVEMEVGTRRIISAECAEAWRRKREGHGHEAHHPQVQGGRRVDASARPFSHEDAWTRRSGVLRCSGRAG